VISEREYLLMEARDARVALGDTLAELGVTLPRAADPRYWVRKHPLASLLAVSASIATVASGVVAWPTRNRASTTESTTAQPERRRRPFASRTRRLLGFGGRRLGRLALRVFFLRILTASAGDRLRYPTTEDAEGVRAELE
jgi:uncharacterized iron-regulated membrane protein